MSQQADYKVTIKVQQGRIWAAMKAMQIKNVAELARKMGMNRRCIDALINFRISPRNEDGGWRKYVVSMCRVLACEPNTLFPDHLQHEVPTNRIEAYSDRAQMARLQAKPAGLLCDGSVKEELHKAIQRLSDRERAVLTVRFGLDGRRVQTLDEAGSLFGVTRDRVRQIENRGVKKLREFCHRPGILESLKP